MKRNVVTVPAECVRTIRDANVAYPVVIDKTMKACSVDRGTAETVVRALGRRSPLWMWGVDDRELWLLARLCGLGNTIGG